MKNGRGKRFDWLS